MTKMFVSPSDFVLGKNILKTGKDYLTKFGEQPILFGDSFVMEHVGNEFATYLNGEGFQVNKQLFDGEASLAAIAEAKKVTEASKADFVIGLGGGKTIDTAKAVAHELKLPLVIIPTLASTDAPTSRMSVIYKADGSLETYLFYGSNPDLVMIDSAVVTTAPPRFLAAGFGDALSTYVEARAINRNKGLSLLNAQQTITAMAIAKTCEETIFKYAFEALRANEAQVVTPALENVIEANILMSGLGFESGGTSGAHSIQNAFLVLGKGKKLMHGERVAFGILCQLMLEGEDQAEFDKYLKFLLALDLPTTLADQGLADITPEELKVVGDTATVSWESTHKIPGDVTSDDVVASILAVDRYATAYKKAHGVA